MEAGLEGFTRKYAFANSAEAERYGRLAIEALEARYQTWLGRGTVRSLAVGTRLDLIGLPTDHNQPEADHRYAPQEAPLGCIVTDLTHLGINNLTADAMAKVAERLKQPLNPGEVTPTPDGSEPVRAPARIPLELLTLAVERGYANRFEALHADTPWRPQLNDDTGARLNPRPTAAGPMSALVVGPHGETSPNGPD